MVRKSPIKHRVTHHKRKSKYGKTVKVRNYQRGSGRSRPKRKVGSGQHPSSYRVTRRYPDGSSDTIISHSKDPNQIIRDGLAGIHSFPSILIAEAV